MRFLLEVAAVAAAALGLAACDKPLTQSAYNNSGASATPAMPAEQSSTPPAAPAQQAPVGDPAAAVSQAPAVSDTASPSAAAPAAEPAARTPAQ